MSRETLTTLCEKYLSSEKRESLAALRSKLAEKGVAWLEVHFASLPRRIGREFLDAPADDVVSGMRPASLRECDLAAAVILSDCESPDLFRLYEQGDALERRMILKSLNFLPRGEAGIRLLQEAHRTNDEEIFRAAWADTALPAEILDDDDFNRGVLKSAFMDVEYDRLLNVSDRATQVLSDMLLQFMSEREAAGRKTWSGSLELAAHAPTPAVEGRIAGDLHHGDDARRLHAVRGAGFMLNEERPALRAMLENRAQVERNEIISAEIRRILDQD